MEKLRLVPIMLRSLAYSTDNLMLRSLSNSRLKANGFPVARFTAPTRTPFSLAGCCSSQVQGIPTAISGASDKDDSRQCTIPFVRKMNHQLPYSTSSSAIKWLAPFSGKLQMRCYASEGTPAAVSHTSDKDDNFQRTVHNDFNWHAHMATGSFLYKGHLILGIRTVKLNEYSKNQMLELRPVYGDPNGRLKWFVKEEAKVHTWRLINSLSEFHRLGLCPVDLDHTKVLICDGVAMYSPDLSFVPANDILIEENFLKLEIIIRGTLFQGNPLPYLMNHLLKLMRTQAITSIALMKCHAALVRQIHKTAFLLRIYDLVNALRISDPELWMTLLSALPYKYTWLKIMMNNQLLYKCLEKSHEGSNYDPDAELQELMGKLNAKNSVPFKLLKKYRGLSVHKMEDSLHHDTGEVLYTEEMFEDILEADLPRFTITLQCILHKNGKLELTRLDSFFVLSDSKGTFDIPEKFPFSAVH